MFSDLNNPHSCLMKDVSDSAFLNVMLGSSPIE